MGMSSENTARAPWPAPDNRYYYFCTAGLFQLFRTLGRRRRFLTTYPAHQPQHAAVVDAFITQTDTHRAQHLVVFIDVFLAQFDPVFLVNFGGITVNVAHHLRSEDHTSELQSRENLVCRLLLEKK